MIMLHLIQILISIAFLAPLTQGFTSITFSRHVPHTSDLFSSSIQNEEVPLAAQNNILPESAAVLPGQVINIRIGDVSNPRKAWKKRRRTGSPVLVPCTILGMNKEIMVKYNLMNLLHRFGKQIENESGVILSVGAAVKLYKYRLGGNLLEHANSLGYDTIMNMLKSIFDDNFFRETGVRLKRTESKRELMLSSSLSPRLARESAFKAEFVQFCPSKDEANKMLHTGTTLKIDIQKDKYKTLTTSDVFDPLSAAVRISQVDADSGRFQTGMECNAFFHSYDGMGDNGSPLITCAIDPPSGQIRDQMKRRAYVKRQVEAQSSRQEELASPTVPGRDLHDLKTGDGPFTATVIKVSPRSGAVFVDLGVTRQKGKKSGGGIARVLGMLRFDDIDSSSMMNYDDNSIEEAALIEASLLEGSDDDDDDDEYDNDYYEEDDDDDTLTVDDLFMEEGKEVEEEDVSDIYSIDEDGNVYMIDDADGGKKVVIGSTNDVDLEIEQDENDDDDEYDEDDIFAGMSPEQRLMAIGDMIETSVVSSKKVVSSETKTKTKSDNGRKSRVHLKQGDKVTVYVRSIFPQSGRFMVTQDATIKNRKLKDLKREKEAEKRLEKLSNKMGGAEGISHILNSVGLEMEGEIKAKSKTGNWYYVQPVAHGFPVGVAESAIEESLEPGQKARIRIEGIDEKRGQLSLTVLGRV
mmetsp:Transcript_7898/g.14880  ORF Transcript_7898/g.14880 Transcript_7898/m.14880 type:complete len:692 (+) Transcript_7898:144-2219(+)